MIKLLHKQGLENGLLSDRAFPVKNVFSVDVEDYFQVTAFENLHCRNDWSRFESRVFNNTMRLIELLEKHDTKGIFFVLGCVAEKFPRLVELISAAGHEIGSHSHMHCLVHQMSPDEFREDVRKSKDAIESIIQKPVTSFRAPTFSIVRESFWALDILVQEGFTVDSSIFPSRHVRNGVSDFLPAVQRVDTESGAITEFPMPVVSWMGRTIPAGGGGYFRLYPYWLTQRFVRQLNNAGRPFMFYVHPWEVDPDQPRVKGASRSARFKHYVNLESTMGKLDRLLSDFEFTSLADCLRSTQSKEQAAWV